MNWLKIFYHLLCATTISVILLIITILMDVLLQNTHLTQLLLNIDFLINPDEVPTIKYWNIDLSRLFNYLSLFKILVSSSILTFSIDIYFDVSTSRFSCATSIFFL